MTDLISDPRLTDRLARGARAARSLSEVVWEAIEEELAGARADHLADLSERLAAISSTLAVLVRTTGEPDGSSWSPQGESPEAARTPEAPPTRESPSAGDADRAPRPHHDDGDRPVAVLVDELAGEAPIGHPSSGTAVSSESHVSSAVRSPAPPISAPSAPRPAQALVDAGIEIRDERREHPRPTEPAGESDAAPWIASIARRLERHERDRLPFAVLLLELSGIERLRHAELPGEVARLTGLVEAALAAELRPADSLTRESPGRYWLLAPETDVGAAKALAARLAAGVRRAASHRSAPLLLAAGIAVCPQDGRRAPALAAHADMALYAAQASGREAAGFDDPR